MQIKLTEKDISAIEKTLNLAGRTEAWVKVENGKVVVVQVKKKVVTVNTAVARKSACALA